VVGAIAGPGSDGDSANSSSRRELLGRAGAGLFVGGGLFVAGCGGGSRPPSPAHKKISRSAAVLDVDILNGLLDIEHKAVSAYTAGIPLLSGHTQRTARNFLGDDLAHAGELASLITRHHGIPIHARTYSLGTPQTAEAFLALFARLEKEQIAAYLGAIPLVQPGAMRASLAAILGSDAQHIAIVRTLLGTPPLAGAFVTASTP
jgi:bacterioferritin (cytochrome b1)